MRSPIRHLIATAGAALVAGALLIGGAAAPAQAAIPAVAQQWSQLMYDSLTVPAEAARMRATLATQRAGAAARTTAAGAARTAATAAQARVTAAATANTTAQDRLTAAAAARTAARRTLVRAQTQRTRNDARINRAKRALSAAERSVDARRAGAQRAAAALVTAQGRARTAETAAGTAAAAATAAATAVRRTGERLAALPTATSLLAKADALSRDVVAQIRPVFTVADTTTVYGTTVHQRVAFSFRRMIDAAKADGVALSGGGFRTRQRQIELRTINGCPDVWTAPASSCRVPTAIPGRSLHELGLAVDITSGGRTINGAGPAFAWLSANAARYGYHNLPSEPWHWSITGG